MFLNPLNSWSEYFVLDLKSLFRNQRAISMNMETFTITITIREVAITRADCKSYCFVSDIRLLFLHTKNNDRLWMGYQYTLDFQKVEGAYTTFHCIMPLKVEISSC
jgi:hypothetical protein